MMVSSRKQGILDFVNHCKFTRQIGKAAASVDFNALVP